MTHFKLTTALVTLTFVACSCHFGRGERTIIVSENNFHLKIEYTGRITFTEDSTAIKAISRNGILRYDRNGEKLEVENRENKIKYRFDDNDEQTTEPNENEKKMIAEAVHEMMRRGHYKN